MKSKTMRLMSSKNNMYALLFVCATYLGCSSSNHYQMKKGGQDSASTSKKSDTPNVPQCRSNVQLHEKVNKFLKEGMKFESGLPVNDKEIDKLINDLKKDLNKFNSNLDEDYRVFLNHYGSIYGSGLYICGSTKDCNNKHGYILSKQAGFEHRCKINKITEEKIRSTWLIAEDENNQYYFDLSKKKYERGYISSIDSNGISKNFSKDFLSFLDSFFEAYKIKSEEETFSESSY